MLLTEISLNPSVEVEDEWRLSRQCKKMYSLFRIREKIGLPVSTIGLNEIADQYQARLFELRRALIEIGLCIDLVKRGKGGVNYYSLVTLEESSFYAQRKDRL